jgi:hypothetical protein
MKRNGYPRNLCAHALVVLTLAVPGAPLWAEVIKAAGYITVTPTLFYIFPLSGDARDEMKGQGLKGSASPAERDSSFFVGGVSLSFSF